MALLLAREMISLVCGFAGVVGNLHAMRAVLIAEQCEGFLVVRITLVRAAERFCIDFKRVLNNR
jgi:hypothetical protein